VFCFQALHEIRLAHPGAEIALLTRAPFVSFAQTLPWIDRVLVDTHPTWKTPGKWLQLRGEISGFAPDVVYDLQGKRRQSVLFALLGGPWGPKWSGAAMGCRFPRPWPPAPQMHFTDFLAAQLRAAGVPATGAPDLGWLDAPVEKFRLPERYAVLIPGCSPNAPHKRWPPRKFAELARALGEKGLICVAVGTGTDAEAVEALRRDTQNVVDLCGKTSLFELAGILRRAEVVIGNDTGPVHMAGALQSATVALFSGRSSPVWSKPPGTRVALRQSKELEDLGVGEVLAAVGEVWKR
jgi:ADP-heptose:LPS heptosyltransferase